MPSSHSARRDESRRGKPRREIGEIHDVVCGDLDACRGGRFATFCRVSSFVLLGVLRSEEESKDRYMRA